MHSGATWTAPTYAGYSARACLGPAECVPDPHGPISTLPRWYENGLVSIGDPVLAFGPRPDAHGHFSWANGSRLYYASGAGAFPGNTAFKGLYGFAVSRTDDVAGAMAGTKSAWMAPVIVTKQNAALFSDKDDLWVDNAATSPFFGNVYECNVAFRGGFNGPSVPDPVVFARSTDGGTTWAAPFMLNNQASLNDQFNQWLAVDDVTGNLGVMYYDTVNDATRKKTDVWFQE